MAVLPKVAVIGAGTMGLGIAQAAATAGCTVTITDNNPAMREHAKDSIVASLNVLVSRGKLSEDVARQAAALIQGAISPDLAVSNADIVIEAIVENLDAKRALFSMLDETAPSHAILATNTSSLSVTEIAAATLRPAQVIGLHFFNPVHAMKLVELVSHGQTSLSTLAVARQLCDAMEKHPILVRDSPGFASSRLGLALGLEAMRMLEEGVASAEDIDTAMVLGYGHAMGPLRVSDVVGLDVRLGIAEYLHATLGGKHFEPPTILRDKVAAGQLGRKSGKGFYEWPQATK